MKEDIKQFFNLHTHTLSGNRNEIAIQQCFCENVSELNDCDFYYSVGIHPWHATEENLERDMSTLEEAVNRNNVLAIGECGLDAKNGAGASTQLKAFQAQISLSLKTQKPLIIHCVKKYQEIIGIKKELKSSTPWVIHSFSGSPELANQLVKHDFHLSFGPKSRNSRKTLEALASIPIERLFLETDEEKVDIIEIHRLAAETRKCELKSLSSQIKANAKELFAFAN